MQLIVTPVTPPLEFDLAETGAATSTSMKADKKKMPIFLVYIVDKLLMIKPC
jgi:hypothetical protein